MGNSINSVIIITIEMITCRMLYESFVVRKKNITDKVYNMSMVLLIGVMFIISRTLKTYIPVKLLAGMIAIVIYVYYGTDKYYQVSSNSPDILFGGNCA